MNRGSIVRRTGRLPQELIFGFGMALAVMILAFPAVPQAHPPQDVALAYDAQAQNLQIKITHKTPWAAHYINKIVVKKNGGVLETYRYESQPDKNEFTYVYKVEAAPGDALEVTAACNIYGSKTSSLTLAK